MAYNFNIPTLSRLPEARNGPVDFFCSDPSQIYSAADSGAQAMHSTTCSWSLSSACKYYITEKIIDGRSVVKISKHLTMAE